MSTFLQQTVNILHKTKQSLGIPNSLSTSNTERLEEAYFKSPIHSEDMTRDNVQSIFNALVLEGPADVDEDGNVIKPPSGINLSTMDYFDDEGGNGNSPFGAPSVGGEGGTPKGPNLVAGTTLASGRASDDGLAVPPVAGAALAIGSPSWFDQAIAGSGAGSGAGGLAGVPGFGTPGAGGAGGKAGGRAGGRAGGGAGGTGGGAGGAGGGSAGVAAGADLWMNTIYGTGPAGAGGGGGAGGSDNPANSSKIIGGQGTGNLIMGSSTPAGSLGQRPSAFKSPWDNVIERNYKG